MKSKMSYKTKRNIIITLIVFALFILATVGTYIYMKSNAEIQASSQMNSASENQSNNQATTNPNENTQEEPANDEIEVQQDIAQVNETYAQDSSNETVNDNQDATTFTQTITNVENVENTEVVVGFTPIDVDLGLGQISVELPDLEVTVNSITETLNNCAVYGKEIEYKILINNNKEEVLNKIEVSTLIPEGTELIEGTITDNGIFENGKITWKIDITDEKEISFKVKVIKTEGNIVFSAIVNGKQSNEVVNTIDEAPVLTVIDPNRYQMEVGTEYKEKGYTAIDKEDGDITDKVVLSYMFLPAGTSNWLNVEEIDTNLLGRYKITYTVTDSVGNIAKGTRVVEIVDTTKPKIMVKDGYIGNKEKNVYSNVSFKLYDNYGVSAIKVNESEWIEKTVNQWSDANFENIKDMLVYGKNTITVKDVAGNEFTYEFVYDNKMPTITVKDGYVGNKEKNVYSNVSFKLSDEYEVIAYKINDGEYKEFSANKYSDANFENIKNKLVYGKNTITVKDIAGNEFTYEFVYDNKKPTITVKDGYIGNKEKNVYSNVSFKLSDEYEVIAYKINNGEYKEFSANKYSDANFNNIKDKLVYGDNTITLKDVAGNEYEYVFKYDNIAPEVDKIQIINLDNVNSSYIKNNQEVRFNVTFKEEIEKLPVLNIGNQSVEFKKILGGNNETIYQADLKIDASKNTELKEGNLSFIITSYKDVAGNEGKTLTESDTKNTIIFDKTKPEIIGITDGTYTNEDVVLNIDDVNPGTIHLHKNGELIKNYKTGTAIIEEGNYTVYVSDLAGNKSNTITFTIDKTAPTATLTYSNDNGNALTNQDVTVTLVASEHIKDIDGWDRVDEKTFTKVYSVGGKYTIEIVDLAGNKATIYNEVKRLDKVAPTAEVTYSNDNGNAMTNQDVTVTLVANESIKDIEGWIRVNDKTFTKVYSNNGKFFVDITDKAGNTSTVYYEVKRIDKVAPVITLPKDNTFEVGVDLYSYPEAGSVYDEFDKEISFSKVNIEWFKANDDNTKGEKVANFEWNTTLSNRELGKYYIEYWVSDKAGNIERTHRILTLQDTTKPTVTLNGSDKMEVEEGSIFTDPGVIVKDNREAEITQTQTVYYSENGKDGTWVAAEGNKVDTNKLGYYAIWYTATDDQGNVSDAIRRIVNVRDMIVPTATVTYDHTEEITRKVTVTLTASEPIEFIDAGYWEDKGNNVYKKVYPYNTTETIRFKDKSGNIGSVEIVINNVDNKGPKAEVSQVNDSEEEGKVWITLAFDEEIANFDELKKDGWTKVTGTENTYHKAYYREKVDKVTVKDIYGNESTIEFTVEM